MKVFFIFNHKFCALCLSAWSIKTKASIASAIGTALIPTQGSCLPFVTIIESSPLLLIVLPGILILDVGFIAILTSISWPEVIPPRVPPELLLRKPFFESISSLCSVPFCVTHAKPAPISTAFTVS